MSTPAWRSTIFVAAVSFAVCHVGALLMPLDWPWPHLAAAALRFALPCGCIARGMWEACRPQPKSIT